MTEDEFQFEVFQFIEKFSKNQEPLEPEYKKIIDDHFWELILDTNDKED